MGFFSKKTEQEKFEDAVDETLFVPYACHYDSHTLVTKNGELLQTIKVTGFAHESIENAKISLRDAVRKSVTECLPSDAYAIWFHTIRRKKNIDHGGKYPDPFTRHVHQKWNELHDWQHKFVNELYITVVREGQNAKMSNIRDFGRGLLPGRELTYRENYLEEVHAELNDTTGKMLEVMAQYGARRLGIYQQDGAHYSEMLTFLGKLINLSQVALPLPECSIAEYLPDHDYAFGRNTLEARGRTGRHFGAILTVKEYKELSEEAIDEFLHIGHEFIITQCIDFINREQALHEYKQMKLVTRLSGDHRLAEITGIDHILGSDTGKATDYGEQQLTIMLLKDSQKELEEAVAEALNALRGLGIIAIREDIMLEECFWAQLPANFEFLRRLMPINSRRIGGFASLYNFPAGQAAENHWGRAAALFLTAANTPYYFNFHHYQNGHTTIIGPEGAGKTVLLNFLLAESRHLGYRLFFFDKDHGSEIFLRAIGGQYHALSPTEPSPDLSLNPFQLPDSRENRDFLALWIASLIDEDETHIDEATHQYIEEALHQLYQMETAERHLANYGNLLQQTAPHLTEQLSFWHGSGPCASLFGQQADTLDTHIGVLGFEMGHIVQQPRCLIPTLLYLLHRINGSLDGKPAIIVLDEAWHLIDNSYFAPRLGAWLEMMRQRNCAVIMATESVKEAGESQISSTIFEHIATQFYLPNPNAGEEYQDVFELTDQEFDMLEMIEEEARYFLLKRPSETIIAQLDLAHLPDILAVLSATHDNLSALYRIMNQAGTSPQQWLPAFYSEVMQR